MNSKMQMGMKVCNHDQGSKEYACTWHFPKNKNAPNFRGESDYQIIAIIKKGMSRTTSSMVENRNGHT